MVGRVQDAKKERFRVLSLEFILSPARLTLRMGIVPGNVVLRMKQAVVKRIKGGFEGW